MLINLIITLPVTTIREFHCFLQCYRTTFLGPLIPFQTLTKPNVISQSTGYFQVFYINSLSSKINH